MLYIAAPHLHLVLLNRARPLVECFLTLLQDLLCVLRDRLAILLKKRAHYMHATNGLGLLMQIPRARQSTPTHRHKLWTATMVTTVS